ncbi:hypothetical protein VNO77_10378 [Canavalia gladiata]|uniref:Uncharacterized protein n=1 Tax=Canavalia gladiata TaxID=3824 RepID=A0AAN9MAY3_CANGL
MSSPGYEPGSHGPTRAVPPRCQSSWKSHGINKVKLFDVAREEAVVHTFHPEYPKLTENYTFSRVLSHTTPHRTPHPHSAQTKPYFSIPTLSLSLLLSQSTPFRSLQNHTSLLATETLLLSSEIHSPNCQYHCYVEAVIETVAFPCPHQSLPPSNSRVLCESIFLFEDGGIEKLFLQGIVLCFKSRGFGTLLDSRIEERVSVCGLLKGPVSVKHCWSSYSLESADYSCFVLVSRKERKKDEGLFVMEKSEPALVPEWLRSAGSVAGAGSSAHHFASPSTHTDASYVAHHTRNRSSKTISDFDSPRSVFLERAFSSNSRRSINGSAKHAYSSFNRSHRDKDRDREKDRSNFGDHWDRDCSEPLADIFSARIERDTLRRSHSMVSRKQNEILTHRISVDTKSGGNSNQNNSNDLLSGGSIGSSIQKAVFDKDFPSLGGEERQGITEIGRVSSPGLGATASQTLPVGSSALIGGEGWTSALAEVPTIIGSSSTGSLTVQQTITPTSGSVLTSTSSGLNMAEALAQTPSRARSTPQVSVKTQRLEELAIKQSRQLIPVTPSMPKALVNNSSEKSKPKTTVRNAEMNMAAKSVPQQPSSLHITNHSVRSGNAKGDAPKTSGKFTDLKSVVWENGVSPTSKDAPNQPNYSNSRPGNHHAVAPAAVSTPLRNPNNLKSSTERKPALDLKLGSTMDKKHSISQVQSRNDFFNLIKKKTLMNSSSVLSDSSPVVSSPTMDKSGEVNTEAVDPPARPQDLGNGAEVSSNGNALVELNRLPDNEEKDTIPDEEEAAFLRSLGWEEDSGEDEGLTEEEINAFYQECLKLGTTTLKLCQGMQPKLSKFFESYATNLHGASAELSSSDSRSEA